jgi:hypothetical protein
MSSTKITLTRKEVTVLAIHELIEPWIKNRNTHCHDKNLHKMRRRINAGFPWAESPEGFNFWSRCLSYENVHPSMLKHKSLSEIRTITLSVKKNVQENS